MGKFIDLTNRKSGWLTAKTVSHINKWGSTMWNCICKCGKKTVVRTTHIKRKIIKSCGCRLSNKMESGKASFNKLFYGYKSRAKRKKLSFRLTKKEFEKLTKMNCHYCHIKPMTEITGRGFFGNYLYNGIDRKNNKFGYYKENCLPCCKGCNLVKRISSYEKMISFSKERNDFFKEFYRG